MTEEEERVALYVMNESPQTKMIYSARQTELFEIYKAACDALSQAGGAVSAAYEAKAKAFEALKAEAYKP